VAKQEIALRYVEAPQYPLGLSQHCLILVGTPRWQSDARQKRDNHQHDQHFY
jgi:hypothetical protein